MSPVPDDAALRSLAQQALGVLARRGWRVALAESCTGGWIAKCLTDIPGSSQQFGSGFVTYANEAKVAMLGVRDASLAAAGAVSREVVLEMAVGAAARSGAQLGIAVSGIAGPDGGTPTKPVGLVWFGWATGAGQSTMATGAESGQFPGGREAVRRQAVACALELIARQASGPTPVEQRELE